MESLDRPVERERPPCDHCHTDVTIDDPRETRLVNGSVVWIHTACAVDWDDTRRRVARSKS